MKKYINLVVNSTTDRASTLSDLPQMKSLMNKIANNEIMNSFASSKNYVAMEGDNVIATVSNKWLGSMPSNQEIQNHKTQHGKVAEGVRGVSKRYISKILSLKFPITLKFVGIVFCMVMLNNGLLKAQPPIVLKNAIWSQHQNNDSFYIESKECLDTLASWVNVRNWPTDSITFTLTRNITTPFMGTIGTPTNSFRGTFDGKDPFYEKIYTINLFISSKSQYVGLFGYAEGATIRNLIVKGTVRQTYKGANGFAGSVVGFAKNSQISNCISETFIRTKKGVVGGVIGGYERTTSTIPSVFRNINNGVVIGRKFVGGVIGKYNGLSTSTDSISQCLNNGRIILHSAVPNSSLGGIVGSATNCVIFECLNIGSIVIDSVTSTTSASSVGGIAGHLNNSHINIAINSGLLGGRFNDNSAFGGLAGRIVGISSVKNSFNTGVISIDPRLSNTYTYDLHPLVGAGGTNSNVQNCFADTMMYRYDLHYFHSKNNNHNADIGTFLPTENMVGDGLNGENVLDNPLRWSSISVYNSFYFCPDNLIYPMISALRINSSYSTMANSISEVAASPVFFGESNYVTRNVRYDFYASNKNEVEWNAMFGKVNFYPTNPVIPTDFIYPFSSQDFYNSISFSDIGYYANVIDKTEDTLEAGLDGFRFKKQIPINNPYAVHPLFPPAAEFCSELTLTKNPPQIPFHYVENCIPCICYEKCRCCKLKEADCEECNGYDSVLEYALSAMAVNDCYDVDDCAELRANCSYRATLDWESFNIEKRCSYCRMMAGNGILVTNCFYCQNIIDMYERAKQYCCSACQMGCSDGAECQKIKDEYADNKKNCSECRARKNLFCKCECNTNKYWGVCPEDIPPCPTLENVEYIYGCNVDCYTLTFCSKDAAFMQIRLSTPPSMYAPLEMSIQTPLEDTILSPLPYEFHSPINHIGNSMHPSFTSIEFCVPQGTEFCMEIVLWGVYSSWGGTHILCSPTSSFHKENFDEAFNPNLSFTVSDVVPSPVKNEASFTVNFTEDGFMSVYVYDMTGAKVLDILSNAPVVANTETQIALNFAKLPSGVYTIMVQIGEVIVPRVFIKQ